MNYTSLCNKVRSHPQCFVVPLDPRLQFVIVLWTICFVWSKFDIVWWWLWCWYWTRPVRMVTVFSYKLTLTKWKTITFHGMTMAIWRAFFFCRLLLWLLVSTRSLLSCVFFNHTETCEWLPIKTERLAIFVKKVFFAIPISFTEFLKIDFAVRRVILKREIWVLISPIVNVIRFVFFVNVVKLGLKWNKRKNNVFYSPIIVSFVCFLVSKESHFCSYFVKLWSKFILIS